MTSILYRLYTTKNNKSGQSYITKSQYIAACYYKYVYNSCGFSANNIDYSNEVVDQSLVKDWDLNIISKIDSVKEYNKIKEYLGKHMYQVVEKVVIYDEKLKGSINYNLLRLALDDIYKEYVKDKNLSI